MKNIRTDIVKKSLDDISKIGDYIKENTSATVQNLLQEAVAKEYVKIMAESYDEDSDDDEGTEDENIEIKDKETEDTSSDVDETSETEEEDITIDDDSDSYEGEESDFEEEESSPEDWSDYSEFQTESGQYDFSNADDDTVVKVYKLLKNSDEIEVVKKDSKLELKDTQTGAEYLIDLDDSTCEGGSCNMNDEDDDDSFDEDNFDNTMKESRNRIVEIVLNEDTNLGYTTNYQKSDPLTTPSMKEPGKNVNDWDAGVPKGKSKPWPGKGTAKKGTFFNEDDMSMDDGDAIEESENVSVKDVNSWGLNHNPKKGNKVPVKNASTWGSNKNCSGKSCKCMTECGDMDMNEEEDLEEATNVGGFVQQNSTSKSHVPNSNGRNARNASKGGSKIKGTADPRYSSGSVSESMIRKHNKIVAENKQMKATLNKLQSLVAEAAVTNLNLGQIVKLLNENSTTQAEKREIIARFGKEAKTIKESKELYSKISNELKKKNTMNINEDRQFTTENSKKINENTIYASKDLMASLDMMRKICN